MKSICLFGMDGSGKSTQSRILAKRLRDSGEKVISIHLFSPGRTVSSTLQNRSFPKHLNKRLKKMQKSGLGGVLKLFIGLFAHFVDAWLTSFRNKRKYKGKWVVYDRFYYDHIALFAVSFSNVPWWTAKIVRFLPKPVVAIGMEVDPETGHHRKPEESVYKLERCLRFNRLIASELGTRMINGTGDINTISEEIYRRYKSVNL